jgi:hypothetical protein
MSDDYVEAAKYAHAAAWKQAFLEQKESALSWKRALLTTMAVLVVSNGMWILDWWMSR